VSVTALQPQLQSHQPYLTEIFCNIKDCDTVKLPVLKKLIVYIFRVTNCIIIFLYGNDCYHICLVIGV